MVAKDLIEVIFKDLDLVWLKYMSDVGRTTRRELIEIVFMLSLAKLRC